MKKRTENGFKSKAYREHAEVQNKLKTTAQRVAAPRYLSLKIRLNETEYNAVTKAAEATGMSMAGVCRAIIMQHLDIPINKIISNLLTGS